MSPSVPAKHSEEEASAKRHKPLPSLLQKLVHGQEDDTKETHDEVPCKEVSVDLKSISERNSAK